MNPDHPVRMATDPDTGDTAPYVLVRDRLEARVNRTMYYHLMELDVEEEVEDREMFGLWSGGAFLPLALAVEFDL